MYDLEEMIVFILNTSQQVLRQIRAHFASYLTRNCGAVRKGGKKCFLLAFRGCPSLFPEKSLTEPKAIKNHFVGSETRVKPIPKHAPETQEEESLILHVAM